jgi:transposase-like protein
MREKPEPQILTADKTIKDIRRATRKYHSAQDKIRIELEGLRGEESIAAICRHEGVPADLTLENLLLKKHDRGWGRMRYPAAKRLEIIGLVEQSHLSVR